MRKIFWHKSPGSIIHYTFNFILITMAALILLFGIQTRAAYTAKQRMQDALTASLLAAAVPSAEMYATQGTVTLLKPGEPIDAAYARFREALKTNMGLDSSLNIRADSPLAGYITGPVSIRFTYYDATPASGNAAKAYSKNEGDFHGLPAQPSQTMGSLTAPVLTAQLGFTVCGFEPGGEFLKVFGLAGWGNRGSPFVTYADTVSVTTLT